MIVDGVDCDKLPGRLREICEGRSGLPAETEAAYRELWKRQPPGTPAQDFSCVHRGAEVRRLGCETCGKSVQIFVFACGVFGECAIQNAVVPNVCVSCDRREPA